MKKSNNNRNSIIPGITHTEPKYHAQTKVWLRAIYWNKSEASYFIDVLTSSLTVYTTSGAIIITQSSERRGDFTF